MSALAWFAVVLLAVTSIGLLLARDWRWLIIFLSTQYFGMLILTLEHWPLGLASVKVVAGWMSAAILGMTRSGLPREDRAERSNVLPQGRLFRLFAAAMVLLIVSSMTPRVDVIMADAGFAVTTGSLLLVGMGLLHLGVSNHILRVTLGLMTVLSGFEILYATVEGSVLVAGLLAIINLGLAFAGSYLMVASNAEEETEPV
ncbi:MAG TPA: hypothetical protein VFR47_14130 [Anaerolineales bacterium]|nr:hypothetical protein [Anaerolineales bacterium]